MIGTHRLGIVISGIFAVSAAAITFHLVWDGLGGVLGNPSNTSWFQVVSYTPLGLLIVPVIFVTSSVCAAAFGVITYNFLRRRLTKESPLGGQPPGGVGYEWSCLACGVANPPHTAVCTKCGCSANATNAEIERYACDSGDA